MLANRSDRHGTAYTITCDFAEGTTTGISAHDRALTTRSLANLIQNHKISLNQVIYYH